MFLVSAAEEKENSEWYSGSKMFPLKLTHIPSAHISLVKESHEAMPNYKVRCCGVSKGNAILSQATRRRHGKLMKISNKYHKKGLYLKLSVGTL